MLIIPKQRTSNIDDIQEYKELDRRIIIYTTTIGLENSKDNRFSLMNVSIQNGNVGGLQANTERLYTVNTYYGTIDMPLFYNPENLKPSINMDALVRIHDYGFSHKMIDTFKDISETCNHIIWLNSGKTVLFKNQSSEHDSNKVVPSDPRFYNLDHQILVTDDDSGFYTDSGLEIGYDRFAREYGGVGFRLRELVDKHTHIYVSKVHIDDPYKMIRKNKELLNYINDTICSIQNTALLALVKNFTIIIDKELGFNIKDVKRIFNEMERKYERFEIANFFESVKQAYDNLMDSSFNIRLTIIYKDSQTNVSILPIKQKDEILNENISDVKMYEYVADTLVNQCERYSS